MIVLINKFQVKKENESNFVKLWKDISGFMEDQEGFISTRFSHSLADAESFVNVAVWKDVESFQNVIQGDEFRPYAQEMAKIASSKPELFQIVYESGFDGIRQ